MSEQSPRHRLVGIDLLRFFAAFAVAFFHIAYKDQNEGAAAYARYPELTLIGWWGWIGVPIFFVISGYVIAYSASQASAASFLRSRFLRLFPGVAVCATITFFVLLAFQQAPDLFIKYVRSLTFWPIGPWVSGVYWTLGVELTFYACVYALLLLNKMRWFEPVILTIGVLSSLYWFSRAAALVLRVEYPDLLPVRALDLLLIHNGMHFALGAVLWIALTRGWTAVRAVLATLFLVAGCLPVLTTARDTVLLYGLSNLMLAVPVVVWLAAVVGVYLSAKYDRPISAHAGPGFLAAARGLGLATYPLYLVHGEVGILMLGGFASVGVNRYVALSMTMVFLVALSVVITFTAEKSIRAYLSGLLERSGRKPRPAESGLDNSGRRRP